VKFTKQEWKSKMCMRAAQIMHDNFENGSTGIHSRIFEVLIPDEVVLVGESLKGNQYREHVVPCCLIRNECFNMFKGGASLEEVASAIERHVVIVKISFEEADHLDKTLGLKNTMPKGWEFNKGDIYARLKEAGIEFQLYNEQKDAA
jgi:hypothetical protein